MTNKTLHTELAIPQPIVQLSMLEKMLLGIIKSKKSVYYKDSYFQ